MRPRKSFHSCLWLESNDMGMSHAAVFCLNVTHQYHGPRHCVNVMTWLCWQTVFLYFTVVLHVVRLFCTVWSATQTTMQNNKWLVKELCWSNVSTLNGRYTLPTPTGITLIIANCTILLTILPLYKKNVLMLPQIYLFNKVYFFPNVVKYVLKCPLLHDKRFPLEGIKISGF